MTRRQSVMAACVLIMVTVCMIPSCDKETKGAKGAKAAQGAEKEAPPETVYAVNTQVVGAGNLDAYLEFGGDVAAASSVNVMPESAGKLSGIYVRIGQTVSRNQLIAQVNPNPSGSQYYQLSQVRSPITGTLTALPYPVGATVAPSMPIATIATADDLEITIAVPERYVSRVKNKQRAALTFDAYPGETFPATVIEVAPVLDVTSRTETVKLAITGNDDGRIKIGMYARVKLITEERKDVIVIPYESLVRRNDKTYLFVCDTSQSIVHLVEVTPGVRVDDVIEITEGLKDGDEIVVKGQTLLNEGSKINILSSQRAQGDAS